MEEKVAEYIGDKNASGLSGLGQTITELKITRDISGHEFLSMKVCKNYEIVDFIRLPERINVQATFIDDKNPLT